MYSTESELSTKRVPVTECVDHFKLLFQGLFTEATYAHINRYQYIPLTQICPIFESVVRMLIRLYEYSSNIGGCSPGITLGFDTPIVVPLTDFLRHHACDYLQQTVKADEVEEMVARFTFWYWIVNDSHGNKTVRYLKSTNSSWSSYMWFVTVFNGGNTVDRYIQLSRFQNHRHRDTYYVQMTFFDELCNLRRDYNRIRIVKPKPTNDEDSRV